MKTIKRLDAKTIGEWLTTASVSEVSKEKRLEVLKACWKVQDAGEETNKMRMDIIGRCFKNCACGDEKEKEREASELIKAMMIEDVEIDVCIDQDTVDQFILSNPDWKVGQCNAISKILQ